MNKKRAIVWTIVGALTLVILLLAVTGVWAEPSQTSVTAPSAPLAVFSDTITFQGRLLGSDGNPIDGSPMMTFRLYTQAEGGDPVWEDAYNVPVAGGLFNADLAVPPSLFDGQALWLGVRVEGDTQEMVPRQQLLPAPYAFYAKRSSWDGLTEVPPDLADGDDDTQYSAGTGLSLAGTQFSIALAYHLPQGCANGDIPEWNDTFGEWNCGSDDVGSGAAAWQLSGNAGTTPGVDVLGTTDTVSLTLVVNAIPALRLEPATVPNLIGGYRGNSVTNGIQGATIGGGGSGSDPHWVGGNYGTIGGGVGNVASNLNTTVGGGVSNTAGGPDATIGGGFENAASGYRSTIGGGNNNTVSGSWATIAGGSYITAAGDYASVGGGQYNAVTATHGTIGGGIYNTAGGDYATVGGGYYNTASSWYATVGGGAINTASGLCATVGGGELNTASDPATTVGGGNNNTASGDYATVGGGRYNLAEANYATIAGGGPFDPISTPTGTNNRVYDDYGAIGGGGGNRAGSNDGNLTSDPYATIGGGAWNTASGDSATVGGGIYNTASGDSATVGGGQNNIASSDHATIGGGEYINVTGQAATVAGGSHITVTGAYATVPGGQYNVASGDHSFAAGYGAQANHYGSFVWSDSRSTAAFASQHHYQFRARAYGGFRFEDGENLWVELSYLPTSPISTSTGAYLTGGGVWTNNSDRNLKENFEPVDRQDVLDRLAELPISTWNYKAGDPNARHMGPVAQDFYAIFGLGEDDRHIAAMDTSGIALAAIQGLYAQNQALEAKNAALQTRIDSLETENAAQEKKLNDLETRLAALEQTGTPHLSQTITIWWPLAGLVIAGGVAVGWRRRREIER